MPVMHVPLVVAVTMPMFKAMIMTMALTLAGGCVHSSFHRLRLSIFTEWKVASFLMICLALFAIAMTVTGISARTIGLKPGFTLHF